MRKERLIEQPIIHEVVARLTQGKPKSKERVQLDKRAVEELRDLVTTYTDADTLVDAIESLVVLAVSLEEYETSSAAAGSILSLAETAAERLEQVDANAVGAENRARAKAVEARHKMIDPLAPAASGIGL